MKKLILIALILLVQSNIYSQTTGLFGGIEIGSKGIKMTILEVDNIKRSDYTIVKSWSENAGIAKGISIDGNLAKEDIDRAIGIVTQNLEKFKTEYKILENNIFLVASSGVAMAKNTADLITAIKLATQKDIEFINATTEAKMLLKGCIPPKQYSTSMVLDIGGGNTKGGYVDIANNDDFVFFPLNLNYGTITLTEAVGKKAKKNTIQEFGELSFGFLPILRDQVRGMYESKPLALEKDNVYMSGGAVWAFYTLHNGAGKEVFNEFKLEDVLYYDAVLKNNFSKYEELAKTDKDVEKVLKTYSQKYLISASNLLLVCLEAVPNINDKKLFFAREGQHAWLVSYVVDRSKRIKTIK